MSLSVFRRLFTLIAVLAAVAIAAPGAAEAKVKTKSKRAKVSKDSGKRAKKSKRRKRRKRRRARRGRFRGHGVKAASLRKEPLPKPSGNIWMYSPNFREEMRLQIYDKAGALDDTALAQLDHGFRCKRTGEERASDPRLAEILSIIQDHFEGKRIELVSAFRFQKNEGSRHFHASAMDIRVEGISSRKLYEFAKSLDKGGMGIGYYPRSGFVHIDFRAPGQPSYRWTDSSGPGTGTKGGSPSRRWKRRQSGS